jgi:HPt (histidine-containing phosphotransfer) domain-containing protein
VRGKTVVRIDPDLSDLIPGFLARKREDARVIKDAIARADYDTLGKLGHRMKGEGGGYGFDAITDFGAALERAASLKDLAAAYRWAERLASYLEEIEVVYE